MGGRRLAGEEASLPFPFLPHRNLVLVRWGLGGRGGAEGEELKCPDSTCLLPPSSSEKRCDPRAHAYAKGTHEGP